MGTVVSMDVRPGPGSPERAFVALARARAVLHRADAVFSLWKPLSPMSQIRRGELPEREWPSEIEPVLQRCRLAREMSGGAFDPWRMPGGLDPTGLVKGWAALRALSALVEGGVEAAMVSAGGDVAVHGTPAPDRPWRIGVQSPFSRSALIGVVEARGGVATSGCYERGPHILDPSTGRPAQHFLSATVTGPDLDLADALATALVAGGEAVLDRIERTADYEALVVLGDGELQSTTGFRWSEETAVLA